jgi:hypothetical protein
VLAVQVRSTEWDGETPLPERERFVGEFEALLTTEMLPLAAPVVAGVKVAVNDVLCPAGRMKDEESPLTAKPAPVTLLPKILTSAGPELIKEAEREPVLLTLTLPKSIEDGFMVS